MSADRPQDTPSPWSTPSPPPAAGPPTYPPAPGTGYGRNPDSDKARSSATLWLILNIVSVLFCSNLPGIVGAIFAGQALGRADSDPAQALRKVRTAKIWFFAGLVFGAVVLVVGFIAVLALGVGRGSVGPITTGV